MARPYSANEPARPRRLFEPFGPCLACRTGARSTSGSRHLGNLSSGALPSCDPSPDTCPDWARIGGGAECRVVAEPIWGISGEDASRQDRGADLFACPL